MSGIVIAANHDKLFRLVYLLLYVRGWWKTIFLIGWSWRDGGDASRFHDDGRKTRDVFLSIRLNETSRYYYFWAQLNVFTIDAQSVTTVALTTRFRHEKSARHRDVGFVTIDRTLSGSNRFLSVKLIKISQVWRLLLLQITATQLGLVARNDWFLRPLRRIALLFPMRETNVYFVRGKTFQSRSSLQRHTRARDAIAHVPDIRVLHTQLTAIATIDLSRTEYTLKFFRILAKKASLRA